MDQERKEQVIERILDNTKTIAVVGLSSKQSRAGYYVPAYLQREGYRIIPVNPHLDEALGEKAYAELTDVPHDVDLVLLFRRSEAVPPFVAQAIEIGADAVWMQAGIVNHGAAEQAQAAGLDVVMDACMMVEHRRRQ
ncbi:MAG: CoA-binding protein [bacterium]